MSRPESATQKRLYKAARALARDGQPVFPCKSYGVKAKSPLTKNGLLDASTDADQIKRWWTARGDAAIGITTGVVWDVLDVDIKGEVDGRKHLPYLQSIGLLNGCKFIAHTPSGGWHLYFRAAPEGMLSNKASAKLGLDVRSKGGYVLAPPSYIESPDSTGSYVHAGETVGSTDEPLLWNLIVSSLSPTDETTHERIALLPSERRASLAALREWVANLQPGERNNGLHWAVCRCLDNGLDPHELVDAALIAGLDEDEVLLTVRSAIRRAGLTTGQLESEAQALFPE